LALLGQGETPVEVARLLDVDRRSVRRWKAIARVPAGAKAPRLFYCRCAGVETRASLRRLAGFEDFARLCRVHECSIFVGVLYVRAEARTLHLIIGVCGTTEIVPFQGRSAIGLYSDHRPCDPRAAWENSNDGGCGLWLWCGGAWLRVTGLELAGFVRGLRPSRPPAGSRVLKIGRDFVAYTKVLFLVGLCMYGLNRLRKRAPFHADLLKSFPQGLKPTLTLLHLRPD
jgi:hypothetical protein